MTSPDARVLLLPLTAKDGATTHALLASAGIEADVCRTFGSFLDELRIGAAAAVYASSKNRPLATWRLAIVMYDGLTP